MFELKEIKNPVEFEGDFQLFDHHGKLLDKVRVDKEEIEESFLLSISTFDEETSKRLSSLSLNDFENRIDNIRLLRIEKLDSFLLSIGFYRVNSKEKIDFIRNRFEIKFFLDTDLFNWKQFYGFSTYKKLLKYICEKERERDVLAIFDKPLADFDTESSTSVEDINNEYELNETIIISFTFLDNGEKIRNIIKKYQKTFFELHEKAVGFLAEENIENTLISYFAFPEQIKTFCKQYLLYFATFLRDLGISADSNLKEEAGKVLFSVTPTDDIEALDKIREALAVYLNLPSSPIVYDESFAAMRLHQQIDNLQHSQRMAVRELQFNEKLLIAQSDAIYEKNLTISQQQSVIEQQNKIIEKISSKSIMMDSVENKEELEEIFEGLKIGKSKFLMEQLGVHLNPATALKTVGKKILGKDERKSVLGLDEEAEEKDN
ncbi:MAG: hypothetical protein M3Q33_14225 [Acidobacteriota bacterium]|nr:hypothetical protein [Acidobacteriota bacterium]